MQPAGQFHDDIFIVFLGVPEHVLYNAATLYTRYNMLNHHADARNKPVPFLVGIGQLAIGRLFLRLVDRDIVKVVPLKTTVPVEVCAIWKPCPFLVADFLVVLLAFMGSA